MYFVFWSITVSCIDEGNYLIYWRRQSPLCNWSSLCTAWLGLLNFFVSAAALLHIVPIFDCFILLYNLRSFPHSIPSSTQSAGHSSPLQQHPNSRGYNHEDDVPNPYSFCDCNTFIFGLLFTFGDSTRFCLRNQLVLCNPRNLADLRLRC